MVARQRLKDAIVSASAGEFDSDTATELTVGEWASEYKSAHLTTRVQSSAVQCGRLLDKEIVPHLGVKTLLSDVTPPMILRMRTELWGQNCSRNAKSEATCTGEAFLFFRRTEAGSLTITPPAK